MATLQDLYAKYFPGLPTQDSWDSSGEGMTQVKAPTARDVSYKAAQAGDLDGWLQAQKEAHTPTGYADSYAMTGWGPQGPSTFNPLGFYVGTREPVVRDALSAISQASGIPDYDWTKAINTAAMQLASKFGGQSPTSQTRLPDLIDMIVQNSDAPLQQTYAQRRDQIRPVLDKQYQQIWNQSKDYKSDKFKSNVLKALAVAAIPAAGYFATGGAAMGAEAGAGVAAEEAGLAAYTNIGAGGGATAGGAGMGIDWGNTLAQSGGTMTDVSPGLFESAGTGGESLGLESSFMGPAGAEEAGLAAYTNIGAGGAASLGGYKFPYGDVIKGALGLYLQGQQAKDLKGIASNAASLSDPFAAERPRYQQQYRELTSAPSNFFKDPAIADVISNQQDITGRKLAASGYNMSGNFADEVARTGQREAFKQYIPFTEMIGRSAGAFQGTQGAGTAYAQPATAANTLDGGSVVGIGNVLESIFKGQQPNSAQQAQGVPKNQNVLQSIFL